MKEKSQEGCDRRRDVVCFRIKQAPPLATVRKIGYRCEGRGRGTMTNNHVGSGSSEWWSDSGYILKAELRGFACGCVRERSQR